MNSKDVSDKSIKLLEEAVKQFLGERPWVADWGIEYESQRQFFSKAIAMGSYFERIFQVEFWPQNDFEFFCLSPAVKKILIDVFHFDNAAIGCFSRYDLFPISKNEEAFQFLPTTQLYYAGRLSPQKNLEFLLLTFFYLQLFYSSDLRLTLIGDFDNEYHKDILGCPYSEYRTKIHKVIESLPWSGAAPEFIHGKNESEWLNCIPQNGLFLSCTNLISEDFSVTAAQLESMGLPMILPGWGGLADVCADNARFYSADSIAHSHLDLKVINSSAKVFARELMQGQFLRLQPSIFKTQFPERKINRSYLIQKILENRKMWGAEIDLLVEKKLSEFVKTDVGQKIFKKSRAIFGNVSR